MFNISRKLHLSSERFATRKKQHENGNKLPCNRYEAPSCWAARGRGWYMLRGMVCRGQRGRGKDYICFHSCWTSTDAKIVAPLAEGGYAQAPATPLAPEAPQSSEPLPSLEGAREHQCQAVCQAERKVKPCGHGDGDTETNDEQLVHQAQAALKLGVYEIDPGTTVCRGTEVCRYGQHLPTNVALARRILVCDIARPNAAYHNVCSTRSG